MEIKMDIPEYNENGLTYSWKDGFEIKVSNINGEVLIQANKAGLISLASQLLTLAQDTVPSGCHFHYDSYSSLEEGSVNLIVDKI